MSSKQLRKFSLKFFRVIWEPVIASEEAELVPRVNRQLSRASERNRIKRVLREFFRAHRNSLKKGRWVFIARPRAAEVPNREIFHDLEHIITKHAEETT